MNCLYAHEHKKCPSESVAKQMLKDVLLGVNSKGKAIIVTTFSSHLARLKSIIEMGQRLNRKIVFLGRSLDKYVRAAERIDLVQFSKDIEIFRHRDKVAKILSKIQREREKYLIVCTGHQGEKQAVLSKIVDNVIPFNIGKGDHVIFSCKTIPAELNIANREILESKLKMNKVRIFKDIHVSGHLAREDMHDFIKMVKPKIVIPCQGDNVMFKSFEELALDLGYKANKDVFSLKDGNKINLSH